LTTTVSGAASTYSVAFTVPASADVGANVLPNIKDAKAKIAQQTCPGYIAKNVSHTAHGFKAVLELAGPAVSMPRLSS
jgi:alpha-glucosidase